MIFEHIADRPSAVGELADRLPVTRPAVSQHLKVLKDAGLVQGTLDPPRVCYCVDPEVLKRFQKLVSALTARQEKVR
jgi:ArsR family transcriptional regulator, arsenate/arsenite/antimonite-responsive transcriptional repressor